MSDTSTDGAGKTLTVPESELYSLYSTLSDATSAAATGDPNECARLTAEAKRHVMRLHEECDEDE